MGSRQYPHKQNDESHLVFKIEEMRDYMSREEQSFLWGLLNDFEGRLYKAGIDNSYYVVKTDEPYADKVFKVIKKGEQKKEDKK